ncbi:MAG: hypothetical protein U9Q30_01680 [Campylobacterota bacterium]|nr:hypothetical protein [Campylobacterota bacterium]
MKFYDKTLFLDQFTPVSIYQKVKTIFKDEITFLFESVLNNSDGNFSYIIIGDRERLKKELDDMKNKDDLATRDSQDMLLAINNKLKEQGQL